MASQKYNKLTKDQLVQLLQEKDEQLKQLSTRLDNIESRLDHDDQVKQRICKIERNGYQLEQYCRRESVEIVGLPDDITDQDELELKVVELFNHAGVKVDRRDFHAIHRLRKKTVVIAKCLNRRDAIAILRAKKSLRETDAKTKSLLGVKGKVFVNESLCPEYRRLFGISNALFRKKLLATTFTLNGSIRVCVTDGGDRKIIGHIDDLIDLVGEEAVEVVISEHKQR